MHRGLTAAFFTATRLVGAGAGFAAQLLLARSLPPHEVGTFFVATSMAAVLALVATQGYPALVQRFATRYESADGFWASFVRHVQRRSLVAATLMAVLVAAFAALFPGLPTESRLVWLATAALMPASYLFSLYPSFANAQSRFALSLLPELMLRPIGLLAIAAMVWHFDLHWSAAGVIVGFAAISTVLALAQYLILAPSLPAKGREARPTLKRIWGMEALPALAATAFLLLFGDIVVIAAAPWLNRADTAAFTIAVKLAMLSAFFVQIAQQVATPEISAAMKAQDQSRLRAALLQSTKYPALAMLAGLVGTAVAGSHFLHLYGEDYARAATGLTLLLAAMLARALMGPGSIMLTLAGAQKSNAAACSAAIAVLLGANAVLVPLWGVTGGCAAVLISICFWTGLTAYLLHRNCGLRSDIAFALRANQTAQAALA